MNPNVPIYGFARQRMRAGQTVRLLEDDVPVDYTIGEDLEVGQILMVDPTTGALVRYRAEAG